MQYLRGWTALRNDPDWTGKVGWGCLLLLSGMCIPVLGQLVLRGWLAIALRRAVSGQDAPLPRLEWDTDYLGKLIGPGFKGLIAQMLWSAPIVAVVFGCYFCMGAGWMGVIGAAGVGGAAGEEAGALVGGGLALILYVLVLVLMFAVLMFSSMLLTVAVTRAEIADDLNAAMRFGEVMQMTKMLAKELIIGMFVMSMVNFLVVFFGIITLYLGLFPGIVIFSVIATYYRAELYRVYLEKGGQPLPVGPLGVEGSDPPRVGQPQYGHPQQHGQPQYGQQQHQHYQGGPPRQF